MIELRARIDCGSRNSTSQDFASKDLREGSFRG